MSVFSNIKPKNHASRNGFDLSRRSVFSNKSGQIIPMFVQPTLPDSRYKIDVNQLMRTQPLQTAAFTGASINYDFVFIPLNHLYSSFNQFIAQREQKNLVNQPSYLSIPTFNLYGLLDKVFYYALYDYVNSIYFANEDAYYKAMQAAFPQQPIDNFPPFLCEVNPRDSSQSLYLGVLRMLDMCGYGNYLPVLSAAFSLLKQDGSFDTQAHYITTLVQQYDSGLSFPESFDDIMSAFKVPVYDVFHEMMPSSDIKPNLWPILGYNKSFYEYYRNEYYDIEYPLCKAYPTGHDSITYVELFNFDDWSSVFNGTSLSNYAVSRLIAMFTPKYHCYKRDLFTGVLPSTQFGSVEVMTDNRDWMRLINLQQDGQQSKAFSQMSSTYSVVRVLPNPSNETTPNQNDKWRFDPALAISVLESRRADAMQRFKERMMRAGNNTKDIFEAHGWSKPLSEGSFDPIFLGSFDGRLNLNSVAATAGSDTIELAQLASHGTCVVSGSEIDFKCHDFGIIVGLNYILKDSEYDAYGLDRHLQLTEAFDYPYPELQNISLSPIVRGELCVLSTYSDSTPATERDFNKVLGYLPRFMEYKTAVDKVHGEFYSANPLCQTLESHSRSYDMRVGVFSDWVTPRHRLTDFLNVSFLYQSAAVFDNVFYQQANSLQSSDQFLFNCFIRCTTVEPLSVIGLPI